MMSDYEIKGKVAYMPPTKFPRNLSLNPTILPFQDKIALLPQFSSLSSRRIL